MSHQAGLAAIDDPPTVDEVLAVDPVVEALAAASPLWEPGTAHGYHALTYGWLVAEIVRRITGRRLNDFLQERVAAPLGIEFWIGLPSDQRHRVAPLVSSPVPRDAASEAIREQFFGPQTLIHRCLTLDGRLDFLGEDNPYNTAAVMGSEIPAANGVTNASSLARMYAATIGEVDGVRLFDDATRELVATPVTTGPDKCLMVETKFSMGFATPDGLQALGGPRSFGHSGAGGSLGYADPDLGIGYGYVMNHMTASLIGDPRTRGLSDAVTTCLT
jgi:CubicO group peptidase (beta-lactamase class C family)